MSHWKYSYPIEVEVTHKGDLRQRALHDEEKFKRGLKRPGGQWRGSFGRAAKKEKKR